MENERNSSRHHGIAAQCYAFAKTSRSSVNSQKGEIIFLSVHIDVVFVIADDVNENDDDDDDDMMM